MGRLKVKKRVKVLIFGLIILFINLKIAIPILIEEIKAKKDENIIENYVESYSNVIEGSSRKVNNDEIKDKFIGAIEIPSIGLKRGLVSPYSKSNNVNKNIQFIKPYHMPNEDNKVMILAAHSGNSKVSHFNKLKYVNLNDLVHIYYKNKKYKYKIIDKYQIKKTGHFNMKEYEDKTILVLLTCNPVNLKKQIVVICEKVN